MADSLLDDEFLLQMHRKKNYTENEIAENVFRLKLRPKQQEILKEFFQTGKDNKPLYEECLLICGKKGGKTFLVAVMNLILVYRCLIMKPSLHEMIGILPNQDVYFLNTCAGKDQSIKVYLNQVKSIIANSPFLQQFKTNETLDEIRFGKNLVLKAQSSRSTSSLGYLCFAVTFDELAWFEDSNNKNSGKSCYGALVPNIKPFKGFGRSFILSSPSDTGTWFYGHYDFAKTSPSRLVKKYSTWVMNPGITRESLEEEFKRDWEKATMDYGAEFVEAVGGAFSAEKIIDRMKEDIRDISVGDKRQRVVALDPALTRDAYALAMGYLDENNKKHIDYVCMWQGNREKPVRIADVEDHVLLLRKHFPNITKYVMDQRYSASTIQRLGEKGLPIFETFFDTGYKAKMYQVFKEELNMDYVFLPRHDRAKNELIALRRKGSGANIRYEAPTSGATKTDDMADAIANCVYQLSMLNEGGDGTDDFSIDGTSVLLDEESIKKKLAEMTPEQRKVREEEEARKKQEDEKRIEKVEQDGGFLVG